MGNFELSIFNIFLAVIFVIEIVTFSMRKKGIDILIKGIESLSIKTKEEAIFINNLVNFSTNPFKQFIFTLFIPFLFFSFSKKHSKNKIDVTIIKDEKFENFVSALRLNIILTSPTMYFFTNIVILLTAIVTFLIVILNNRKPTVNNDLVENVIQKYAC